jgi:pimeloyl-ACP methyl ester carboxylesterase
MLPLQERLGAKFQTVSTDWPGFGNRPRPRMDWRPEIYAAFLAFLIGKLKPSHLHAVVAAGHAATYALAQACAHPNSFVVDMAGARAN